MSNPGNLVALMLNILSSFLPKKANYDHFYNFRRIIINYFVACDVGLLG